MTSRKLRIVLTEDDPDVQAITRAALRRADFDVVVAGNGREALARAAEARPDVVLLDWMMPEMDGPETCARLKADPATRDVPVIFFTARAHADDERQARALGACGVIFKPFDAFELGARVRSLLDASGDGR